MVSGLAREADVPMPCDKFQRRAETTRGKACDTKRWTQLSSILLMPVNKPFILATIGSRDSSPGIVTQIQRSAERASEEPLKVAPRQRQSNPEPHFAEVRCDSSSPLVSSSKASEVLCLSLTLSAPLEITPDSSARLALQGPKKICRRSRFPFRLADPALQAAAP